MTTSKTENMDKVLDYFTLDQAVTEMRDYLIIKRLRLKDALKALEPDLKSGHLEHVGTDADVSLRLIISGIDSACDELTECLTEGDVKILYSDWVLDLAIEIKL